MLIGPTIGTSASEPVFTAQQELHRAERQQRTRRGTEKPLTIAALRDRLIRAVALGDDVFYDQAALQLVEQFEAALRQSWEIGERLQVRRSAEAAIAAALSLPEQWRLL